VEREGGREGWGRGDGLVLGRYTAGGIAHCGICIWMGIAVVVVKVVVLVCCGGLSPALSLSLAMQGGKGWQWLRLGGLEVRRHCAPRAGIPGPATEYRLSEARGSY
jgi:hypothetical protein